MKSPMLGYYRLQLPEPTIFENQYVGKTALIMGTGMSTQNMIKYKNKINKKFDVVIGLNFCIKDFEENLTHHLVLEKNPHSLYVEMEKSKNYRKDLPRILNWKTLYHFPKDLFIIKAARNYFDGVIDIRKYKYNNKEGFIIGPANKQGVSVGTVALQGLHLAGIMGCTNAYIVGVDLIFGDNLDHYYGDRFYRDNSNEKHKSPIIREIYNNKECYTTRFFKDSANYLNNIFIPKCFLMGMNVYTFSQGLVSGAIGVNLEDFFGE